MIALVRDVLPSKWLDEALETCVKVRGDIRNLSLMKRVLNQYEVGQVYHLAATASVKTAYRHPTYTYQTNIMGTVNVLEACRQIGVPKTLVTITDKVFGERLDVEADDPVQASEPYATSKACSDLVCDSYLKTYNINVIRARFCNVYGLDYSNRIVPNTVRACLEDKPPVIFKDETESVRQYIYVDDVVDALTYLMQHSKDNAAFNVCTESLLNQKDVVLEILDFFPALKPRYITRQRPPEIIRQSMKLTDFGWKPKYNFKTGIQATIQRFREYGW